MTPRCSSATPTPASSAASCGCTTCTSPPYEHASGFGAHEADRPRKLLAHRGEIDRLGARVAQDHLTLIPLALYFKEGRAKVELALAKGRKSHDRRQDMAKRDADREMQRAMADNRRGK